VCMVLVEVIRIKFERERSTRNEQIPGKKLWAWSSYLSEL